MSIPLQHNGWGHAQNQWTLAGKQASSSRSSSPWSEIHVLSTSPTCKGFYTFSLSASSIPRLSSIIKCDIYALWRLASVGLSLMLATFWIRLAYRPQWKTRHQTPTRPSSFGRRPKQGQKNLLALTQDWLVLRWSYIWRIRQQTASRQSKCRSRGWLPNVTIVFSPWMGR